MRGVLGLAVLLMACGASEEATPNAAERSPGALRVATYNVSLYREEPGQLISDLRAGKDPQIRAVAEIIAAVSPDVLVLNEFDHDESGTAITLFAERMGYPYSLALPSNTGVPSGVDLDGDGVADHPPGSRDHGGDAFGYGTHPGQYAIAVLSRFPIEEDAIRTYRKLLWRDVPRNRIPEGFYSPEALDVLRLSSKTHALVPIEVPGGPLTMILAHPTPPGFDGPEDRNGRRNQDEVRLVHDLIDPARGPYLTDDLGRAGGLPSGSPFVVLGDLNADPTDGDANSAIADLLASPLLQDPHPRSAGAIQAAARQGEGNTLQSGDPALDTADFSDGQVGNLRVDYVLPSSELTVIGSGVFWPAEGEPGYALVGPGYPVVSSDHRLVWVDLEQRTASSNQPAALGP